MKLAVWILLMMLASAGLTWDREILTEQGTDTWGYPDSVVASVSPGQHPRDLCTVPDGSRIYIAVGFGLITVVDTSDNTITGVISAGSSPRGICCLPGGDYVYLTDNQDHTVTVVRTSDNTITDVVDVPGSPWGICSGSDGQFVYVSHTAGFVSVIRTADNLLVDSFNAGVNPGGICCLPDGEYIYVADGCSPWDTMISTSSLQITRFFTGLDISDFEPSPGGDLIYGAVPGWNMVVEISTEDNTLTGEYFDVGTDPTGLCVLPGLGYPYVTSPDDAMVFVISPMSGGVIDTVAVGSDPLGICALPSGDFMYVACQGSNRVDVIGCSETGIGEGCQPCESWISVSPSPCSGAATAAFTTGGDPGMLSLFDLSGRLLSEPVSFPGTPTRQSLDITGLPPGLLIVNISTASVSVSRRFVVIR